MNGSTQVTSSQRADLDFITATLEQEELITLDSDGALQEAGSSHIVDVASEVAIFQGKIFLLRWGVSSLHSLLF
jgi:hypothetical protein